MNEMERDIEPHLRWRLLADADAESLEALQGQLEVLDNSVLTGLAATISGADPHVPARLAVGGWDSYDSLVAYGLAYVSDDADLTMYLMGGVHPVNRHLGIGSTLLRWQINEAIAWRDEQRPGEQLTLCCHAELGRPGLERTAESCGFTPKRVYYDLHRDLSLPIAAYPIAGVDIVEFDLQHSEEVRLLHNRCFSAIGGAEVSEKEWGSRLEAEQFRAAWSAMALIDGKVVGYAMSVDEGEPGAPAGWTERFGVDPAHRGKGISLGLLTQCLVAMRAEGCVEAGIGIDSPDGLGLARIGTDLHYTTRDAVALLVKVVD